MLSFLNPKSGIRKDRLAIRWGLFGALVVGTTWFTKYQYEDWQSESFYWESDGTSSEKPDPKKQGYNDYHDPFVGLSITPEFDRAVKDFFYTLVTKKNLESLPSEDRALIENIVAEGKQFELPFVLQLVEASSVGVSNLGERTENMNDVTASIVDTVEVLDHLLVGDRIDKAYGSDDPVPAKGEVYTRARYRQDVGRIALEESVRGTTPAQRAREYENIVHESGHRYPDSSDELHDSEFGKEMAHLKKNSADFAKRVLEEEDYQYYLSGLFTVAYDLLRIQEENRYSPEGEQPQTLEVIVANEYMKSHGGFLTEIGVTQDELVRAIESSRLLEYIHEMKIKEPTDKNPEVASEPERDTGKEARRRRLFTFRSR
jgi:hypothetical protein